MRGRRRAGRRGAPPDQPRVVQEDKVNYARDSNGLIKFLS